MIKFFFFLLKDEDINDVIRISNGKIKYFDLFLNIKKKKEKGGDINDELLKQGKWMNKKLYLIHLTCGKLKEIRSENITQILNQNTKLIQECNILRGENEQYNALVIKK